MSDPGSCTCGLCGLCKAPAELPGEYKLPLDEPEEPTYKGKGPPPIQNWAGGVRVFVLGTVDGKPQVDMYSGVNGLHIRTIPGRRWRNPVLLGAGRNYLAVVDRFENYDVLRVTDQYGGAGEDGFDNGMPKDSVNWEGLADLCQVRTPAGTHCSGLMINQGGVLIANVTSGGVSRYIRYDVEGRINNEIDPLYEGDVPLDSRMVGTLGAGVGNPAGIDGHGSPTITGFMGLSTDVVYQVDMHSGKISKLLGLPSDVVPIAVGYAAQIISILYPTKILRFDAKDPSYLMSYIDSPSSTPKPQDYQVKHTFTPKDNAQEDQDDPAYRIRHMTIANAINSWRAVNEPFSGETREILPEQSSAALNENRMQIEGVDTTKVYGTGDESRSIPVSYIDIPPYSGLIFLETCFNTLTELYNKYVLGDDGKPTSVIDTTKLLFRSVHGSHYDYLSDGGFTYGCKKQAGGSLTYTNGIKAIAMATDTDDTPGTLKPLKDVKCALIDAYSGLIVYRSPKPIFSYPFYDGEYVTLQIADETKRTDCTTEAENIVESIDGVRRYPAIIPSPLHPEDYLTSTDLDSPWALFVRHALTSKSTVAVFPVIKRWSSRDSGGDYLPGWDPAEAGNPTWGLASWEALCDPRGSLPKQPELTSVVTGGFYALSGTKLQTTVHARARSAIAKLQDQNADIQAVIDTGTLTPEQLPPYQERIAANNAQIAQEQLHFDEPDTRVWVDADNTTNNPYNKIGLSEPQLENIEGEVYSVFNPPAVDYAAPPVEPLTGKKITDFMLPMGEERRNLDGTPKYRACVIEPTFRSWVGLSILCDFEVRPSTAGQGTGVGMWFNPEYDVNSLGKRVGGSSPMHSTDGQTNALGHSAGYTYESGWLADGGADAIWKPTIKLWQASGMGMDKNPECSAIQIRNPDELSMAPPDIADQLGRILAGNTGGQVLGQLSKGYVYCCVETIGSVDVNLALINYARDVFRFGLRTFQVGHGAGAPNCAGGDPGYYVGNNCEATMCGNVDCLSDLMFGNKLYAEDKITPLVKTPIVEIKGSYTINDPWMYEGFLVGRYIHITITFKLNNYPSAFNVDIRPLSSK